MFLIENRCPHRGGPLKFSYLDAANCIVCPMHHNAFAVDRLIAAKTTLRLSSVEAVQ